MPAPLEYAHNNRDTFQAEPIDFLRIPGVSTQAAREGDTLKAANWVAQAMTRAGGQALAMREGGAIPVVNRVESALGLPTVLMGFSLPSDGIHSPNERFYRPNFDAGIATGIRYLGLLSQAH